MEYSKFGRIVVMWANAFSAVDRIYADSFSAIYNIFFHREENRKRHTNAWYDW